MGFLYRLFWGVCLAANAGVAEDLGRLCAQTAHWRFGQDRTAITRLAAAAYRANPAARPAVERALLGILKDRTATFAGKQAVCRILRRIGGPASVPVLSGLLGDEKLGHMALYALAAIPGPEAEAALRGFVERGSGPLRSAAIAELGRRRDFEAVSLLARIARAKGAGSVAAASVAALGAIGNRPAAAVLLEMEKRGAETGLGPGVDRALLVCAARLGKGAGGEAGRIYSRLLAREHPVLVRAAALRGLAALGGQDAVFAAVEFLGSEDAVLRRAGASVVATLRAAGATAAFVRLLPGISAGAQVALLHALGERGDPAAAPAVLALAVRGSGAVQRAAIEALRGIGGGPAAESLIRLAAGRGPLRAVAVRTLETMRGKGVEAALIAGAGSGPAAARVVCLRVLAARGAESALPVLFRATAAGDAAVRRAAYKALAVLAPAGELGRVLDCLAAARTDSDRSAALRAARAVILKRDAASSAFPVILAALNSAKSAAVRAAYIRLLSTVGGKRALEQARKAWESPDSAVRDAALRTLAAWKDPAAVGPLLDIAAAADSEVHRVLALRGCARLLSMPSRRRPEATTALFRRALALARRPQEKMQFLAAMAKAPSTATLRLAAGMLSDKALAPAAAAACRRILDRLDKAGLLAAADVVRALTAYRRDAALAAAARDAAVRMRSAEYEAERAVLSGAIIERIHGGASGKAYVDFILRKGASIRWRVAVPESGTYTLGLRFALASGVRPLRLEVDGKPFRRRMNFKSTGGWSKWTLRRIGGVRLTKGVHTIGAVTLGWDGPNIDYLELRPAP